jgi:hypothetical protein
MTSRVVVPGSAGQLQFLYAGLMVNAVTVPSLESTVTIGVGATAPNQLTSYSSTGQTAPPAVGAVMGALTAPALVVLSAMWAN